MSERGSPRPIPDPMPHPQRKWVVMWPFFRSKIKTILKQLEDGGELEYMDMKPVGVEDKIEINKRRKDEAGDAATLARYIENKLEGAEIKVWAAEYRRISEIFPPTAVEKAAKACTADISASHKDARALRMKCENEYNKAEGNLEVLRQDRAMLHRGYYDEPDGTHAPQGQRNNR